MTTPAGGPAADPAASDPASQAAAAAAATKAAADAAAAKAASGTAPITLDDKSPASPALDANGKPVAAAGPANPDTASTPVTYESTGDVGLDMALAFVGKLGIDSESAAMKAAGDGDFTMLRAQIAAMPKDKTQGWEQMLQLGEHAFKNVSAAQAARAETDRKAIYEAAGGEENWKTVQAWANESVAKPEHRAQINATLKGGGLAAEAMAAWLAQSHAKLAQTQERDGSDPRAGGGAQAQRITPADTGNGPLSPAQFAVARAALIEKKGTPYVDADPEYIKLTTRRRAFRG